MAQIFLSYSRDDQEPAIHLAKDLKDLGHTVWLDQELTGGQAWWDQILARIRACDLFVFVLSSAALYSTACQREYGYAAELKRPILPVLVRDGLSLNVLPPALSQVQFIDFRQRHVEAIIALSRALQSLPVGVPLPDPLPAPPEVPVSYLATLSQQIETPSVLTFEEQSRLVVELKRGLRDPATFQDSRDLLGRLRARRDLLATIAEEIDEVVVREPKGLRRASRINLRPAAIPLSWESSPAFVETPRPGRLDGIRVISWLWGWMSSDPSTLRRVAQQKILAHWLVLLIPVLLYQLRFWGSYVFVVGLSLASGLIIGIVSIYLFRNPIPTLGGILTFVSLCFAPISVPGLHEATPFLGCVVISGSLSQWVIQRARRRLAVLP